MTRTEYTRWANDLKKRLPDTGAWLFRQPEDTRDHWFESIFSKLDLHDCLSANDQLFRDGIEAYEREKVPAIIATRVGEIKYRRQQRAERFKERKLRQQKGTFEDGLAEHFDGEMKAAYLKLLDFMRDYRERNGVQCTPEHEVGGFVDREI